MKRDNINSKLYLKNSNNEQFIKFHNYYINIIHIRKKYIILSLFS